MMDWHHVQVELLLLAVYLQYFFFSQNNNRGGYNVGDKTDKAATSAKDQYNMVTSILILK